MFKFVNAALIVSSVAAVSFSGPYASARQLTAQDVVDLALAQAPQVKKTEYEAMRAEGQAEQSRGVYDLTFRFAPSYEYTEAQTLTGTGNPSDRTFYLVTSLAKRFSTGTTFVFEFNRTSQESTLGSFSSTLRKPNAALDYMQVTIRQALLQNIFGEADRATLDKADANVVIARLLREENLEEAILNSLSLYWNAYVAETQLRENTSARSKYEELVKAIRRKAGYNLSAPGELPRLEAEFEATDTRVKLSSQAYLSSVDTLRTALQVDPKEPIEFKTSIETANDLPAIPKLGAVDVNKLRPVVISKMSLENADRDRTYANSVSRPRLDLVGRARATGVDETSDMAFSKMTSASKPTYSIGFELEWPLDSSLYRGTRAIAEAGYQIATFDFKLVQDGARDRLLAVERLAIANRDAALSSIEIVSRRSQVVRELETSYRQGRTPLVELIRAYNDMFAAQQDRARAIGNYMIALNQWAASRDELVRAQ